jgi:hypothetical protein
MDQGISAEGGWGDPRKREKALGVWRLVWESEGVKVINIESRKN